MPTRLVAGLPNILYAFVVESFNAAKVRLHTPIPEWITIQHPDICATTFLLQYCI